MMRKTSFSNNNKKSTLFFTRIKITQKKTKSWNENRLNEIIQMGFNVAHTQILVRIDLKFLFFDTKNLLMNGTCEYGLRNSRKAASNNQNNKNNNNNNNIINKDTLCVVRKKKLFEMVNCKAISCRYINVWWYFSTFIA